jgi:hypothetical protein
MTIYSLLCHPLHNFRTTFKNPSDSDIQTSIREGWMEVGRIQIQDGKIKILSSIIDVFQDEYRQFNISKYKTEEPTIDRWLQSRGNFATFNEWIASANIPN